ncbi:8-amino-7-oxononanoate synthase [Nitrobacter winogradskyi]|uniref:8-amino-7-oxononanoate synthase n=2 Tax=Nitrobacter winogradskyi TaxID=913 RepID=A0ACC6AMW2_NITWI|nr:8-amino-7-oxononanoate synthase [Nitrobacter winogradskyi]MCP2000986.1 8-amino-7-oxononanoate synthase [Nitrobacter winogradskyi]GEC16416.1 8-amino-7-oxononanoate synthase [Nitrobacter winogradskyi]
MTIHGTYKADLQALADKGRLRTLRGRSGVDLASNDYLGLAESEELRQAAADALARGVPVGSGGSRLLRGNHPEHEALEREAAAFFGAESALYFGGGYVANFAIFSTLPQRGDLVVHDELIHASVHDGIRRGRAEFVSARHNDADAFDAAIVKWRGAGGTGRPWLSVESLYSMDGDSPNLQDLFAVADRHEAMVVIDEAHATGVLGPQGRGLAAPFEGRDNVITLHTCGKALGTSGGFILAPKEIRDFLVNRARPFIYATAPSPLIAAVTRAALELSRTSSARRERLAHLVRFAGGELRRRCHVEPSGSHIVPVIVGADQAAVNLAASLQRRGFDIRAIRPPTVPEGTARLRIALTLHVDEAIVADLFVALAEDMRFAA